MARIVLVIALSIFCVGMFAANAFATTTLEVTPILLKYDLNPGQKTTKILTAINRGDTPLSITTVVKDYGINKNNVPVFGDAKKKPYSAANWMSVDTKRFVLEPNGSKNVELTIDVPKSATAGGHYGAVMFELGGLNQKTGKISVGVVGRMAALSLVTIAGEVSRKGSLDLASLPFYNNTSPVPVKLNYTNKGNVHLSTRGTLEIQNWFGKHIKSIQIPEAYVIPGTQKTIEVAMTGGGIVGFYKTKFIMQEKSIRTPAKPSYFIVFPGTLALGILLVLASMFLLGKRQGRKTTEVTEAKRAA